MIDKLSKVLLTPINSDPCIINYHDNYQIELARKKTKTFSANTIVAIQVNLFQKLTTSAEHVVHQKNNFISKDTLL